jgi:hypothetical protein
MCSEGWRRGQQLCGHIQLQSTDHELQQPQIHLIIKSYHRSVKDTQYTFQLPGIGRNTAI